MVKCKTAVTAKKESTNAPPLSMLMPMPTNAVAVVDKPASKSAKVDQHSPPTTTKAAPVRSPLPPFLTLLMLPTTSPTTTVLSHPF